MESATTPYAANEPTAVLVPVGATPAVPGGPARGDAAAVLRADTLAVGTIAAGPSPAGDLAAALRGLRDTVGAARFPLDHGGAGQARDAARALCSQLDDYLLPRAGRLDAPVLAVVGGSTGAGKSTLVNSLVRAPVSRAGVLRPTTTGPVLVCHPRDAAWFGGRSLLPAFARGSEPGQETPRGAHEREGKAAAELAPTLQVVSSPLLRPGLALLDAPDFDSVVARNRELAHELLAAADLWLFVTTAARYADEVPWRVLRGARDRGTVVAVVLDRVPPQVRDEIGADLNRLLSEQGLPAAPLFVVDESTLDSQGLLPADQVAPIGGYLGEVATDEVRRRSVARRTLLGAVSAATATASELAWSATQQCAAADALAATVRAAYDRAARTTAEQLAQGVVLRGAVHARWQESVASGELGRALRAAQDPARARPAPAPPGRAVLAAIVDGLTALVVEADTRSGEEIADRWYLDPAGRPMLDGGGPTDDHGAAAADELVRQWQEWVREQARRAASTHRARTRGTASASVALLTTIVALAPPAAEVTAAGSASDAVRRVLAVASIVELGAQARAELVERITAHLSDRGRVWLDRIEALGIDPELPARLRQAATDVGIARQLALAAGGRGSRAA